MHRMVKICAVRISLNAVLVGKLVTDIVNGNCCTFNGCVCVWGGGWGDVRVCVCGGGGDSRCVCVWGGIML